MARPLDSRRAAFRPFSARLCLSPINGRKTLGLRGRGGRRGGEGESIKTGATSIKTGVKSRAACLPSIYPPRREEAGGGGRIIEGKEKLRRNEGRRSGIDRAHYMADGRAKHRCRTGRKEGRKRPTLQLFRQLIRNNC